MAQFAEDNVISTVFHKVKDRFGFLSEAKMCDLVDRLIKALTIKISDPHPPVNTLPGGNAQRVSIAKWLAIEPRLLILNSPTVGVDIINEVGIYGIISDLAARGITVLMICDKTERAWYQSHRVLITQKDQITHSSLPDGSSQARIAEVVNG